MELECSICKKETKNCILIGGHLVVCFECIVHYAEKLKDIDYKRYLENPLIKTFISQFLSNISKDA